jgi:hypothetical protein
MSRGDAGNNGNRPGSARGSRALDDAHASRMRSQDHSFNK